MIRRTTILLLLLFQAACSWQPEDPREEAERIAGAAESTDIMKVEPGAIVYNGRRLTIGSDLSLWKEVLGDSVRIDYAELGPRFYFWDDLGIRAQFNRPGQPGARTIDIYLIRPDYYFNSPAEIDEYAPRSTYRGKLYVEGVRVGGDVSVRDLRSALFESWHIGCLKAIGSCALYEISPRRRSGIALMMGDKLESGPIESVQVAPPRAKDEPL